MTTRDGTYEVRGQVITPNYFETLGRADRPWSRLHRR